MNLPNWLIAFFREELNGAQVALIDENWWKFTCISLSNSTREQLLAEANNILTIVEAKH